MTCWLFVNTGSVGNALGEPLCCYALLEGQPGDPAAALDVTLVSIPYDREAAIAQASASQVPRIDTFIREVETGRYSR